MAVSLAISDWEEVHIAAAAGGNGGNEKGECTVDMEEEEETGKAGESMKRSGEVVAE